jgi:hypothetical protein
MAASRDRKETPDFFDDLDPIEAATMPPKTTKTKPETKDTTDKPAQKRRSVEVLEKKKKVGYYFSPSNVDRLDNVFLGVQIKKLWKGKISEFMEAILEHGLDDLESDNSRIIKKLQDQQKRQQH